MRYKNVTITTNHEDSELIANAMFDAGAEGLSIVDKEDFIDLMKSDVIWDYIDESILLQSDVVSVSTIVELDNESFMVDFQNRLDGLCEIGVKFGEIMTSEIDEADWANEWKKYYKPIATTQITIVPTWIKYEAAANEKIMRLDPGMAFGTGEHATTRMCLELMDVKDKSVIDVGCGSGILGIAAELCGAKSVYMCDIDEGAVEFAKRNAELNNVRAEVVKADLLTGHCTADFIFANITADILMRLSKNIGEHLNANGVIVISGIIDTRLSEVVNCYQSAGFQIVGEMAIDCWRALKLTK